MIPKLYQKDGTTLIGDLTNCIECLVEEERNGIFEVTFQYPNTESISTSLVYDNIVICDANDTLKNQKFRIYDTRRMMNNTIEVYARHISFDLAYDYINSIDITNQSCEYALNTIFRNSQFSTGYVGHSDIVNAQNYKISNCNALEAIAGKQGSIIDTYGTGAEILRDNTDIYVLNKRGNDNEVSIEYAKNLTGFELQENTDDLITRIIPFATYTPEGGEQTRVQGSTIDSSYINNYSHPFIAEIDFSDKFKDKEEPTPTKLNTMAQRYFEENKCDLPKQNWKIEFIPLSKCVGYESIEDSISLCDTVTIRDTRYNIDTKAKVIKTVYDVLRERYDSMELGEPRTTLGDIVNTGSEKGEQGPPGPQGPKGEDGNIGDFPDSVPAKPVLTTTLLGFASIQLDWTYENKPYYWYEVYASKTKDFTPNLFDIVHKGQTSSFLFQAKPGETWYFRVCGVNSYDHRSEFSDQKEVITTKVNDLSNYFTNAAIGNAVVGSLTADYMTAGILKGNWIDAKNLSVTDGNGKRTFDIDSFGNVSINATNVNIKGDSISTIVDNGVNTGINNLKIGGHNKLLNTQFEEAKPGTTICPHWGFWGNVQIYSNQGQLGFGWQNAIYLQPLSNNSISGIYQDLYSEHIPANTTITFSGEIWRETNVLGYSIIFEYYNSDNEKINQQIIRTHDFGYGYFEHTFTTLNIDYAKVRVAINHNGVTDITQGLSLLYPRNLMLELSNKASNWQPATEDMASTSIVKQTAENITYEFKKKGGTNLIYNGNSGTYNHDGWYAWNATWWNYTDMGYAGFVVSDYDMGCVGAKEVSVMSGAKYSLMLNICPEENTGNFYITAKEYNANGVSHYQTIYNESSKKDWHTVKTTFTTDSDTVKLNIEIWSKRRTSVEGGVTWYDKVMLFEGSEYYPNRYIPYIGGIFGNTTTIDGTGVTVYMNNAADKQGFATLNYDGLTIYNSNSTKKAWFGESDTAFIDKIMTNKIEEPTLIRWAKKMPYKLYCAPVATGDGTGRDSNNKANSISNALEWIRSNFGCYTYKYDIHIYLAPGDYWGAENYIGGWLGTGCIYVHFDEWACLKEPIYIEECSCPVFILGSVDPFNCDTQNNAYVYINNVDAFKIRNSYVTIAGLNIQNEGWGGAIGTWDNYYSTAFTVFSGARVFITCCDIVGFYNLLYVSECSIIGVYDCKGHNYTKGDVGNCSIMVRGGICPLFSNDIYCHNGGQALGSETTAVNSSFMPKPNTSYNPPVVTENWQWTECTFWATGLWTTPEGSGNGTTARSGCWGQGKWSSYKSHRGYASFNEVNSWCSGGRNFTAYLTMTRLDTGHGYAEAVPIPKLKKRDGNFWSCGQAFARGDTYTIQLPWEVASWLIEGASSNLEMWAGTSTNDYSFYNNVSIRIVCEKNFV